MDWLIAIQKWLYGGMSQGMKAAEDISGLPALMGAAFLFGMVHALMPGHGKSVLVSYHLGRQSRLIDGVITGTLLSLTHVGMAVILVLAGVAVISRSLALGGRAPAFEVMSAALIALVGAYLLFRVVRSPPHPHARDGRTLAFVTGLVPCPLTTFILTYALAHDKLAVGLAAVVAMMGGVVLTIVSFAVTAVTARDRLVVLLQNSVTIRQRLAFWLEFAGAVAVLALGLTMLADKLKWL